MKKEQLFGLVFVVALGLMPVIALCAPRFLAFWPGIVGVLSFAAFPAVYGRVPVVPKQTLIWIAIVVVLAVISSFWALDPDFARERASKVALVLFPGTTLMAVVAAMDIKNLKPFLKYLPVPLIVAAIVIALDMNMNYGFYRILHGIAPETYLTGAGHNRGTIAIMATLFVVAGIAKFVSDQKMILALFVSCGLMFLATHSQSAQLGMLLGLLCFFAFPYSRKFAWHGVAGLLILCSIAAPFLSIWLFGYSEFLNSLPFIGEKAGFAGERLEIWDAVSRYALQNPLYGFGMEATRAVEAFDMDRIYRDSVTALHPHNFALQLWMEYGVIGIVIVSAFFIRLMQTMSTYNFAQAQIALPAFAVLLTAASFGYGLWQSWFLGLIVFTIAFAQLAMRLYEDNK